MKVKTLRFTDCLIFVWETSQHQIHLVASVEQNILPFLFHSMTVHYSCVPTGNYCNSVVITTEHNHISWWTKEKTNKQTDISEPNDTHACTKWMETILYAVSLFKWNDRILIFGSKKTQRGCSINLENRSLSPKRFKYFQRIILEYFLVGANHCIFNFSGWITHVMFFLSGSSI